MDTVFSNQPNLNIQIQSKCLYILVGPQNQGVEEQSTVVPAPLPLTGADTKYRLKIIDECLSSLTKG